MRDLDDVFKLMSIAEKATQWPELRAIHDEAKRALLDHAQELAQRAKVVPAPEPAPPPVPSFTKPLRGVDNGETDSE